MAQTKTKKAGLFRRLGRFLKQSWSELKKVSWPNFHTVVKNTGIVLAVVLFFLLVILGLDLLFGYLLIELPR
jgi:preprotein translocase subunit SecE